MSFVQFNHRAWRLATQFNDGSAHARLQAGPGDVGRKDDPVMLLQRIALTLRITKKFITIHSALSRHAWLRAQCLSICFFFQTKALGRNFGQVVRVVQFNHRGGWSAIQFNNCAPHARLDVASWDINLEDDPIMQLQPMRLTSRRALSAYFLPPVVRLRLSPLGALLADNRAREHSTGTFYQRKIHDVSPDFWEHRMKIHGNGQVSRQGNSSSCRCCETCPSPAFRSAQRFRSATWQDVSSNRIVRWGRQQWVRLRNFCRADGRYRPRHVLQPAAPHLPASTGHGAQCAQAQRCVALGQAGGHTMWFLDDEFVVEQKGIEPSTSALRTRRSPS